MHLIYRGHLDGSEFSYSAPRAAHIQHAVQGRDVAQCLEGSTPLVSLAVDQRMNPNVLHRWGTEHERYGKHTLPDDDVALPVQTVAITPANWFALKPLAVADDRLAPTPPVAPERVQTNKMIEVTLAARGVTMTVRWPSEDRQGLARFARELLA
ncbi:hypothetical protein [Eoetvoesiella caeni]